MKSQEELDMFQELMVDINQLEEIELPSNFHDTLMERIRLECDIEDKQIPSPTKPKKWRYNWKVMSGIAATFIISVMMIDSFKAQFLLREERDSENVQMKISAPESSTLEAQIPQIASEVTDVNPRLRAFSIDEPELTILGIEIREYESFKEEIRHINTDLIFEEESIQEVILEGEDRRQLSMRVVLLESEKEALISKIRELYPEASVVLKNEAQKQKDIDSLMTLNLVISEIK